MGESLEEIVRLEVGEEGVGATLSLNVVLDSQADDLRGSIFWSNLLLVAEVDLASELEVTACSVVNCVALSLLALLLSHGALLVHLMALSELLADSVGIGGATAGEPWVSDDISDAETLVRVELEHAGDQILELLGVEALGLALGVGVSLPEEVRSVGGEKLVVVILLIGHAEGRVSRVEDEKNHTKCEKIDNLTLIWLASKDLRGHVAWGTNHGPVGAGAITSFERASKTEINNFDVIHLVEEDVFRFKIAMRETLGVDVVDTHEHLLEVVLANSLIEGAGVCDIIKELTARDHLLGDVGDFNGGAVLLVHGCALFELEVLDDVSMVKLGGGLNFFLEKLEGTLVEILVV